ncbi:MAG: hypothetical protein JO112_03260, partial [Planctomycetes bacterium]|nr:hypothetical protein [Planctomycetota bacterium]
TPWADAVALLVEANVALARRNHSGAMRLLKEAAEALDAVDMRIFAEAARRRLGELMGGSAGDALIAAADSWMAGQLIRNPERMARMYVPGPPDRAG